MVGYPPRRMETLDVISRNETIGRLEQAVPDMWYLEGRFVPASSEAAQEFSRRASALDAKAVFADPTRGIRAAIASTDGNGGRTTVIIFSLSEGQLFLRRVMEKDAVAWAETNVP